MIGILLVICELSTLNKFTALPTVVFDFSTPALTSDCLRLVKKFE